MGPFSYASDRKAHDALEESERSGGMDVGTLERGMDDLLDHMRGVGYSERYIEKTGRFCARLIEAAPTLADWDEALAWTDGLAGDGKRPLDRLHLVIARQYALEGVLPRTPEAKRYVRPSARKSLCPEFARLLDAYEASASASAKRESTVSVETSAAACLLKRLEALGARSVGDVTEDMVLEVLTNADGEPAYSACVMRKARAVIAGAASEVDGAEEMARLIQVPRAWRKVQPSLSEAESRDVANALESPDAGLSLRDRAIGWTLLLTGLRSCDVAALRLTSIDWGRDVIEIVQRKTGSPLSIPLPARLGNAIVEYAANERGKSGEPYVFLSKSWPFGAMTAGAVRAAATRVLDAARVRPGQPGRGSHVFRRGLVTSMIGSGVDRAVVASVVGHTTPKTTDLYMVASVEGLRKVALDVSAFPVREGVLDSAEA